MLLKIVESEPSWREVNSLRFLSRKLALFLEESRFSFPPLDPVT